MLPWRASSSRKAARRAKVAGDWARAAQHYRRAIERDPRNAPTWVQYGNALRECGRAEEAETAYRRSLALAEDDPDAHVQLGHLLKQQRRGDGAIAEYLRALEFDPWLLHASQELIELGWTNHVKPPSSLPQRKSAVGNWPEAAPVPRARPASAVIFDASDLMLHFMHARLPTGIQRVQLQIIASLVAGPPRNYELLLACFAPCRDFWVGIPEDLFVTLTGLAIGGGATDERPWLEAVLELTSLLVHGDALDFPTEATLVNLGASWPHLNYFLRLRNAKARYGLRFIPFVHDCVPVLMPDLRRGDGTDLHRLVAWAVLSRGRVFGEFEIDRGRSIKTRGASRSSYRAAPGHSVGRKVLDRGPTRRFEKTKIRPPDPAVWPGRTVCVDRLNLRTAQEPPAGLHSLVEPVGETRLAAYTASRLRRPSRLEERGSDVLARLQQGAAATGTHSDGDRGCRSGRPLQTLSFHVYPSGYEGWGLPVTGSLCYGKVPLISTASSLPEAGGEFAEYFDLNSLEDLVSKAERLLDDQNYRTGREAFIRDNFGPRSWSVIADQVIDYALTRQGGATVLAGAGEAGGLRAPPAAVGPYYAFARGRETNIRPGMVAGEMFRIGEGWWVPEEWGCWLKDAHADIVFSLPEPYNHPCLLYLGLRGLPMSRTNFELSAQANEIVCEGTLEPDQYRWAMLKIEPKGSRDSVIHLRIASHGKGKLAEVSGGIDRRVVTLGVVGFYLSLEETSSILAGFAKNHRVELAAARDLSTGAPHPDKGVSQTAQ